MLYFYYFVCLTLLYSCGGRATQQKNTTAATVSTSSAEDSKYTNSIRLASPEKNKVYTYNEDLTITFENKDRHPIDSAAIFINGEKIAMTGKEVNSYVYRLQERNVGPTSLKVVAWHPNNKQGIASTTIFIKPDKAPTRYNYKIINTYQHDKKAYTQGLIYHNGYMYEGTGQYGESSIRKTDMKDGKILSVLSIDSQLFGEGITIYQDKIYQITWRSRKGFIYDLKTFTLESTFEYNSEGWGITTVGNKLIMSDGSNKLYHIAPSTFNILKEVEVYDNNGKVQHLNELEYVDGMVWANVWLTNRIIAIDPETGAVKGELDLSNILSAADKAAIDDQDDVLNGIAWNPEKKTFYVTGKRWPKMFEIKIGNE